MKFSEKNEAAFEDFNRLDFRVGRILKAEPSLKAKIPAFKLQVDFGPLGILNSSARITRRYTPDILINRMVVAVVNFPSRKVADTVSQCLVLGAVPEEGDVILLNPDPGAAPGDPVF